MTRIDTELKPKLENLNNSKKTLKKLNTIKAETGTEDTKFSIRTPVFPREFGLPYLYPVY